MYQIVISYLFLAFKKNSLDFVNKWLTELPRYVDVYSAKYSIFGYTMPQPWIDFHPLTSKYRAKIDSSKRAVLKLNTALNTERSIIAKMNAFKL